MFGTLAHLGPPVDGVVVGKAPEVLTEGVLEDGVADSGIGAIAAVHGGRARLEPARVW